MIWKALLALTALAFMYGCQSARTLPDLAGTWKVAEYSHHHEKHSFGLQQEPDSEWVISRQDGIHFEGRKVYTRKILNETDSMSESFSGVIRKSYDQVYIVDHEDDIIIGDIISPDELHLYILGSTHSAEEEVRAGFIRLVRERK